MGVKPYGNYRKLYESIRQYDSLRAAARSMEDLAEVETIWSYYETLTLDELRLIRAAITKTEAQIGYIPFCLTTIPFVFLIFSSKLTSLAPSLPVLLTVMAVLLLLAVYVIHRHFTLKAHNALHAHIVDALLDIKAAGEIPAAEATGATEAAPPLLRQ